MSVAPKILPDDHDAMIELFLRKAREIVTITGVVHVGAHRGQEVGHYRAHGIPKIVLIEANPVHCHFLETEFTGNDIRVIHCAVTDIDGDVALHVNKSRSGNDESSSILELKELAAIVPALHTSATISVPARRLDTMRQRGVLEGCNFLNVDIQGAELRALAGAKETLASIDAVLIETNLIEMYAQCGLQSDIDSVLSEFGFECAERVYHELYQGEHRFPAWGESLYVRC